MLSTRVRKAIYSTELAPRDSVPILDIDRKFISYSQHCADLFVADICILKFISYSHNFADLFVADICTIHNLENVTFLALNFIPLLKYFMNELAFRSYSIFLEMKKQLSSKFLKNYDGLMVTC